MRRIICLALLALLVLGGACAESDLSDLTLSELYDLRRSVDRRIEELENAGVKPQYESGTYRVGVDMPEGVYVLQDNGVALFPSVLVRAGGGDGGEVLNYELVIPTAVMRFVSGSFVTLSDVTAYPFELAPEVGLDQEGSAFEGGYWVGEQIPAGYYRVLPDEKAPLSSYSVYDDVPGAGAHLLKFEVVDEPLELMLDPGQYINMSGCGIQRVRADMP
ncbi:MAG: hypothetical protein GX592_07575 [Clostridiales bacterium]|nr:hypothetical protein [Clostridiales bacterium]